MMTYFKGKKTIGWRALQAARRGVPMTGDPMAYRLASDYFKLGFAKGFNTALRLAKRGNGKFHD